MAPFVNDNEADSLEPLPIAKSVTITNVSLVDKSVESIQNLTLLLKNATASTGCLAFYGPGNHSDGPSFVTYASLASDALDKATWLGRIPNLAPSSTLLLHFDTQQENIEWFWAATVAGLVPAFSTPFVNDPAQRSKHLHHLNTLLRSPIILTPKRLVHEFLDAEGLCLYDVESLSGPPCSAVPMSGQDKAGEDIAALMLTSGSTGSAKAVPLKHKQILKAVQGKSLHHGTISGDVFLNWVGLDHVASLTEIHLQASEYIRTAWVSVSYTHTIQ
jgi:acyl-CoA synthetase (AMP-forming)/AMP-acid ligase II